MTLPACLSEGKLSENGTCLDELLSMDERLPGGKF